MATKRVYTYPSLLLFGEPFVEAWPVPVAATSTPRSLLLIGEPSLRSLKKVAAELRELVAPFIRSSFAAGATTARGIVLRTVAPSS